MIAFPKNPQSSQAALPDWITGELIVETRAVWEPMYGRTLTEAEVVEILLSFGRLLDFVAGGET